ncbi:MAG TPA: phosphatidate cytidylyltransferase [Solimonas sp.]|nr:phosphatidate cytidylyltransferase [Solimonas sp.]
MLIQRVLTALVLLPLLLAAVWFAPTAGLYGLFSLLGLLMAWEWTALMRWSAPGPRLAYGALTGLLLAALWFLPQRADAQLVLFAVAALWWAGVPALFRGFPGNLERHPPPAWLMGLLGLLLVSSTLLALAALHAMEQGVYKLLYLLFLVFAADTGAFLAGRNFGRRKLAPSISPGKTIEGAIGGLLLCAAWALAAGPYAFALSDGRQLFWLVLLSMLVAAVSIVGDLTESMFKRMVGIKDSGHILPGHGGILDRVDSILAAAPVMVLGLHFAQL